MTERAEKHGSDSFALPRRESLRGRAGRVGWAHGEVSRSPIAAAEAHARIEAGTVPWVAIGDFLDDWRRSAPADRLALAEDPLVSASAQDAELHRWAALIAAIVDWLCWNEEPRTEPPSWVADPVYRLPKPWFLYSGWQLRAWQLATTPAPFKMRNIFSGDRVTDRV